MRFLLALTMLVALPAAAQNFGAFPPNTQWKQIDTDTARVIYSGPIQWQAKRISGLISRAAADTPFSLGPDRRKINVVLHNRTTLANGYVAYSPFRSEFYLVPPPTVFEFGNLPWYQNLAIHEYRHVQQYNNFRNGLAKPLGWLFGEGGYAFANAITVPDWFFEGDAVHSETALTLQGRGRVPYFLSGYNSLFTEGRKYNWQKLRNGSLKDYIPNHYQLGYLLTNYGYLKYGDEFWKNVTRDASAFRGLFYPLQKAVKRYAGVDYRTFRDSALKFYASQLPVEQEQKRATVTQYYYPQPTGTEGEFVFLRSAYNRLPAFYYKDGNGERRIGLKSIGADEWFSYRDGKIAYSSYSVRSRWRLVDYSDIRIRDAVKGGERVLTHKKRYFSPDISPNGSRVFAVRVNDSLLTSMEELSMEDGSVLRSFQGNPDRNYIQPRYSDATHVIMSVRDDAGMMSMEELNLETGVFKVLIPAGRYSVGLPYVNGQTVYFTANFTGNDELYAMVPSTNGLYQITNGVKGNYYATVADGRLRYVSFTSNGMLMRDTLLSDSGFRPVRLPRDGMKAMFPVAGIGERLQPAPQAATEETYKKSTGLFRFHSWLPNYNDPEYTLSFYSDNILNTFSNELFYRYNSSERSHALGYNAIYGGWFPQIIAGAEYITNRNIYTTTQPNPITLNSLELKLGYSIPLNFTKGKTYRFLTFGSRVVDNSSRFTGASAGKYVDGHVQYVQNDLAWSQYLPMALQHIYPKFGYTVSASHRNLISESGFQFVGNAQVFLPSVANHSIQLQFSIQETDTSNAVLGNRFSNSRGYLDYYLNHMYKVGVNYHFPIIYPDFGIASIAYLLRVRGNAFHDFTRVYSNDRKASRDLRSVGGEIYFDTKWWNQLPVSFGFRVSHLLDRGLLPGDVKGSNYFEFIVPVNLINN